MTDEKKTYLVNIESNLKKYSEEAAEAKKKVDELTVANMKLQASDTATAAEKEAGLAALKNANDEYRKAASLVKTAIAANTSEIGSRKQLGEQLKLQEQALGKLGNAYITNAKGQKELNPLYITQRNEIAKTKQAIIDYDLALNDGRSNIGRYGDAVQSAFVDAGKSMLSMLSPAALVTGAIALIAKSWKEVTENIKLYLESADKLKYGAGGFTRDSEAALADAAKRARGGLTEGTRLENEAKNRLTLMQNLTDEQRTQLQLQIKEGQEMQKDNIALLDSLGKNKDKGISLQKQLEWKQKYSTLLKEEEALNDERLAKETEWEALEADLIKQRAIVSDQESTAARKKQAAVDADIIASKLASDKITFVNKQIDNITAIAEMTDKQEVVEDRVNGLLKERNTIQKEYYSDQIKINRLKNTASKGDGESKDEIAATDLQKAKDEAMASVDRLRDLLNIKKAEEISVAEATGAGVLQIQKKYAAIEVEIAKLTADQKLNLSSDFASNIAAIFGKNTAIGKAAAIAETTINTYRSATAAYAALAGVPVVGPVLGIAAAGAAIAAGIANVKKIIEVKVPGGEGGSIPSAISSSLPAQRAFANQAGSTILTQQQLSQNQLNAIPNQNILTADDIARALSNMPAPIVTIEDINAKAASKRKVEVRATI